MITSKRKTQALLNGEIDKRFAFLPLADFQEKKGRVIVKITPETREKLDGIYEEKLTEPLNFVVEKT